MVNRRVPIIMIKTIERFHLCHDSDVIVTVGHFGEQLMASDYYDALPCEAKERYSQKISLIGDIDPYNINPNIDAVVACDFPPVDASDIVS